VNSSNSENMETAEDNRIDLSLPVRVKTDLIIRGLSVPNLVTFNISSYEPDQDITEESDIGPEVTHIFQVENQGPSDIIEAEVYILWPSSHYSSRPLLYLTEQPVVEGPGHCQYVSDVNTHNVKIQPGNELNKRFSMDNKLPPTEFIDDLDKVDQDIEERVKRSTNIEDNQRNSAETEASNNQLLSELNCGLTQCTFISCIIGPLSKNEFTLFKVKSRLWVRNLDEMERNELEISSKLVAQVTSLPYGVSPTYLGYKTHIVTTQVLAQKLADASSIPLWILILAILAGFLFLSLVTFILYKLGFFRRTRPEGYNHQGSFQEKIQSVKNSTSEQNNHYQRISSASTSIYYPGQKHPDMLPGDEAL